MTVTLRSVSDLFSFARFTWSDDMQDCSVFALGPTDADIDAMINAGAHEGADLAGWSVEIS